MKEKNDFRRLKQEADIEQVVNYLGINVQCKGSANFIICPYPDHNDTHPTNCYFKQGWNNVFCKACGQSIQAIDLIMYTTGCDYGKAADTLWEIEGKPSWYQATSKPTGKNSFQITGEECRLIGLRPFGIGQSFKNWQKFLNEKEFKKLVFIKCRKKLFQLLEIENYFGEKLFEKEESTLKEIVKRVEEK